VHVTPQVQDSLWGEPEGKHNHWVESAFATNGYVDTHRKVVNGEQGVQIREAWMGLLPRVGCLSVCVSVCEQCRLHVSFLSLRLVHEHLWWRLRPPV